MGCCATLEPDAAAAALCDVTEAPSDSSCVQRAFDTLCLAPGSGVVWLTDATEPPVGSEGGGGGGGGFGIFDVNLYDEPGGRRNVARYLELCLNASSLLVTLSCFAIWSQHKKRNGHAKVIPAVPARPGAAAGRSRAYQNLRVFFFDDNLAMDGGEESPGICNLRDIDTGEFVDFGEGRNGFRRGAASRHTGVAHSSEYRAVLVQANILDALAEEHYFTDIIERYAQPEERVLVFMDVNSTLVCVDTVTSKSLEQILLGTMFELLEAACAGFDLTWDAQAVRVEKRMTLKQIARKVLDGSPGAHNRFYTYHRCTQFFGEVSGAGGGVRWASSRAPVTPEGFCAAYEEYIGLIDGGASEEGITKSWFNLHRSLAKQGHILCMNSFGVDTRKILVRTVPDEFSVVQLAVNFNHWDARDVARFEEQYGAKCQREALDEKKELVACQLHKLIRGTRSASVRLDGASPA